MFVKFRNTDEYSKVILTVEKRTYTLDPKGEIEVPLFGEKKIFTADMLMPDFDDELQVDRNKDKIPAKIMKRLAKKLVDKIPEIVLLTRVTYELSDTSEDCEIFFSDGLYSVCDGYAADFFDMMPVGYFFAQAETNKGTLRITDVKTVNRKQYLKVQRNFNLFMDWDMLLPDLFLFIPKYLLIKFYYTADFYVSKKVKGLYELSPAQRIEYICKKEKKREKVESGFGCLKALLWGIIILAIIVAIGLWASGGESSVIVSEDYSTVTYFDETFVRIDGGLPEDTEKVFLGDFYADYPNDDGTYDHLSHYVYIYEDSNGNRYLWLIKDYNKIYDRGKTYEDYENPLVYKSAE